MFLSVCIIPSLIFYLLDRKYLEAILSTQILLLVAGVRLISFWSRPLYLAIGKMHILTEFALLGAIVTIPTYMGATWIYGFQGLSISRLLLALMTDVPPSILGILFVRNMSRYQRHIDKPLLIHEDIRSF